MCFIQNVKYIRRYTNVALVVCISSINHIFRLFPTYAKKYIAMFCFGRVGVTPLFYPMLYCLNQSEHRNFIPILYWHIDMPYLVSFSINLDRKVKELILFVKFSCYTRNQEQMTTLQPVLPFAFVLVLFLIALWKT